MSQFGSTQPGSVQTCGRCEALLMDVLDGAASVEDQKFFDEHAASCTGCSQMLADARRGGAWLEMLRDPRPEPPAALFERILAQTSGLVAVTDALRPAALEMAPRPLQPATVSYPRPAASSGAAKVLPFQVRGAWQTFGRTMLQPRLAMTAAMAFFSIALTLNLTGVHVSALRASDLRPSNLRRQFYEANAHVVRYCDNLRVVYELEARTHDLQRSSDADGPAPAAADDSPKGSDAPAEKPKAKPKPGPGTSRGEPVPQDTNSHDGRMVAVRRVASWPFHSDVAAESISLVPTIYLKGDPA